MHLTVIEGGSTVEVWLIDLGPDEAFADFIKRTRDGQGGSGGHFV